MTTGQKKLLWICLLLPVLGVAAFLYLVVFNPFHAHEHCIKNTGLALRIYATDHGGRYPYSTNGFGNALLALLSEGYLGDTNDIHSARLITAPGDNGQVFLNAVGTSATIPDDKCSRIYVQGLSETNNPDIALIFDKKPTPGGDHGRRPWGPLLREVCMVDGSMKVIREENWKSFANNQVALLVQDGVERPLAERYYRMAESKL